MKKLLVLGLLVVVGCSGSADPQIVDDPSGASATKVGTVPLGDTETGDDASPTLPVKGAPTTLPGADSGASQVDAGSTATQDDAGALSQDASSAILVDAAPSAECVATVCDKHNAMCGVLKTTECGGTEITCGIGRLGACPSGEVCNDNGVANRCGTSCVNNNSLSFTVCGGARAISPQCQAIDNAQGVYLPLAQAGCRHLATPTTSDRNGDQSGYWCCD